MPDIIGGVWAAGSWDACLGVCGWWLVVGGRWDWVVVVGWGGDGLGCASERSVHPATRTRSQSQPTRLQLKMGFTGRYVRPPGSRPPWCWAARASAAASSTSSRAVLFMPARSGTFGVPGRSRSPPVGARSLSPLRPAAASASCPVRLASLCSSAHLAAPRDPRRGEVEALLPPELLNFLQENNIDLADLPSEANAIASYLPQSQQIFAPLVRAASAALAAPQSSPAYNLALWQMERALRARSLALPAELHSAVGRAAPPGRTAAGPSPRQEVLLLQSLREDGLPQARLEQLLDHVATNRAHAAIGPGSGPTYASHQRMIEWACTLLGAAPVPASVHLVRRVAALVNSPSTLRGWLAAWRDLHIQRDLPWVGDSDPLLRRMRTGTQKLAPPQPQKRRLRRGLLRSVLQVAARREEFQLGAAILFAYLFGLRVPSELLAQVSWARLRVSTSQLTIVGLKRKAKSELSDLTRLCVCSADEFLCWHLWLQALGDAVGTGSRSAPDRLFPISVATYTAGLQRLLAAAGVPATELPEWTSHCARRGSAADVLASEGPLTAALGAKGAKGWPKHQGLARMLEHGEWASKAAASHYASTDEMDRHALAQALINGSDSE